MSPAIIRAIPFIFDLTLIGVSLSIESVSFLYNLLYV